MQLPLDIRFRNTPANPALETHIRKKAQALEHFYDHIIGCHVLVEQPHQRHHDGRPFHVRIEVTVPGEEIVVSHDTGRGKEHEWAQLAVNEAFAALGRRLEDYARRLGGEEKSLEAQPRGKIQSVFPYEGYGFIETDDGREIYFHRNSVIEGFERLEVGMPVRFVEEMGEQGPQASTVHVD
jgi:cold shock CspA family protein/ribosome-associated translation inhibitor RaiA